MLPKSKSKNKDKHHLHHLAGEIFSLFLAIGNDRYWFLCGENVLGRKCWRWLLQASLLLKRKDWQTSCSHMSMSANDHVLWHGEMLAVKFLLPGEKRKCWNTSTGTGRSQIGGREDADTRMVETVGFRKTQGSRKREEQEFLEISLYPDAGAR